MRQDHLEFGGPNPGNLMLHDFITENRDEIIDLCRVKVGARPAPRPTLEELRHGVPRFLDQLAETLRLQAPSSRLIRDSAALHGGELLHLGFTVGQVVHDYGDICQSITELALEKKAPISTAEFRTLNRCLDDAIANAVTEYGKQRDHRISAEGKERLGVFTHELRNLLNTAMLSFEVLQTGSVGVGGATGAVLGRSLSGLRDLVDRSLADARLIAGIQNRERIIMSEFIEEVEVAAAMEARERGLRLTVVGLDGDVAVAADRQILSSVVANLLQNAFKFTRPEGHVSLRSSADLDRVRMEVEDECGGLPPGDPRALFLPFEQRGGDRTGLGLGLAISRRGVEASGGVLKVRNLPGKGCVFTIDLPRAAGPVEARVAEAVA
jgi:signal transduction histidine kinase